MKKTSITLHITGPDGAVSESTSELESVIVGSGAGAAVKVTDPGVSNLHCMLKVEKDGSVTVIDLGSESGTRLKDAVVKDPTVVASGDVINIGGSRVKVVFGEGEEIADDAEKPAEAKADEKPAAEVKAEEKPAAEAKSESKKDKKSKKKDKAPEPPRALAGTGRNAAALFSAPLPAEAVPTDSDRVLQVALLWGDTLINVQHFAEGVPVTVGEAKANRFTVYAPSVGAGFTLARSRGSTAVVNVPPDAGLVVTVRSESHKSKEQLKSEGKLKAAEGGVRADAIELGLHDRAQISLDNVAFIIRYVRPSAAVSLNRLQEHDFTFFKVVSICLMMFIALVAAMVITPAVSAATATTSSPTRRST